MALGKPKLVLVVASGAGKEGVLRQLARQKGSGPLHHLRVGETDIQASWKWKEIPAKGMGRRVNVVYDCWSYRIQCHYRNAY